MDLVKLNNDSRALLEILADRLPPETVAGYRRLSDAGEWGELVDSLCAPLVRRRTTITVAEYQRVADLLALFGGPREGYAYLSDPQDVLAKLTVGPS
ncbi:hypothetical protein [Actinokineospora iranica]|uniref:Uncharacterized protein n=1 Tax=Actinokineospora iranica TaxID=1271860 RepID=A0A1G6Q5B3_9PSEU|nr:hypothetical protein [Actinokineospora iranica]SDC87529.1 hypothetical protein SAMN05216174_10599 [Actinokineospora iranica]